MKNLESFKNHPFQVRDDDEMQDLVERINKYGVIEPLIVRPKENGNYEIISGHRRKRASELAHYREIPCIIRNVDDDTATIMMVDSNNKREHLLPSEKAFAYKMRLDAEKRQGNRTDLTSSPLGTKLENYNTAEKIGEMYGDSKNTVYRYIRLTELLPEILNKVDEGIIGFRPAVEISYLNKDNQRLLLDAIEMNDATPTYSQALKLKELSKENKLTDEMIYSIMEQEKPNQIEKLKLNYDRVDKLLPKTLKTDKQKEDFIIKCIEEHNQREKNKSRVR